MTAYEDLCTRAEADPAALGLILTGSMVRAGTATAHSDHDVIVVVEEFGGQWPETRRTPELDEIICPLSRLRDTSDIWSRYAFRGARILLDRRGGEIATLVEAQATPTESEAATRAREGLGGYPNLIYRAAKSRRDGRPTEERIDEMESVSWFLTALFALHGRVRPYNKYLRWELATYPLGEPWDAATLPERIAAAPASLFGDLERLARAPGFGDEIEAWADELPLIRAAARA